ncbi:MAG TPA: hypothetical protein VF551_09080, partial [Chthoniobacterales bacterium]
MKFAVWFLILSGTLFAGCTTAKRVAVTSFRVVDAPARYIRDRIDANDGTTTTTTTTYTETAPGSSDVISPGHPVNVPPPPPSVPPPATQTRPRTAAGTRPTTRTSETQRPTTRTDTTATQRRPPTTPTPRPSQNAQFPTARPVPGRPGYV